MNELLADTRFWLVTLGAAIVGLVKYLFKAHTEKMDARLSALEADAVRKSDLAQLRADMERRHTENLGTLAKIETAVTGTHKRIDAFLLAERERTG